MIALFFSKLSLIRLKTKTNWFHQLFFLYQFLSLKMFVLLLLPTNLLSLENTPMEKCKTKIFVKDTIINKNNSHTRERRTTCIHQTFCHLMYWVFSEQIIYVGQLTSYLFNCFLLCIRILFQTCYLIAINLK